MHPIHYPEAFQICTETTDVVSYCIYMCMGVCSEILMTSFIQGLISIPRLNDNNLNDNSNLLLYISTMSYWRNSSFGYYRLLEQELDERSAISHYFTFVKLPDIFQIIPETLEFSSNLNLNFSVSFREKFHTLTANNLSSIVKCCVPHRMSAFHQKTKQNKKS